LVTGIVLGTGERMELIGKRERLYLYFSAN
jgi:hypothetical protein